MGQIQKDFMAWARIKIWLQARHGPRFFYEREIWWAAIGHNVGNEEDGKGSRCARPVLILRKFNKKLFWGVPLSTAERDGLYYVSFRYTQKRASTAILSQLRAYDSRRLLAKDGVISELDFTRIQLGLVHIIKNFAQK